MSEGRRPDTKRIASQVIDLLEAELATGGYDLLDVRVFQGGGRFQIRIFVDLLETGDDTDGGVSMDRVARASRTAGMLLEEADIFAGQYVIEVSSPGIRRPLRKPEHYRRAIGEKVDLKVSGSSRVRGILQELDGDELVVLPAATEEAAEPTAVRIKLDRIVEGNLDPEFDVQAIINADRRQRKDTKRRARQEKAGRKKKSRPKNRPKDRPENDGGST